MSAAKILAQGVQDLGLTLSETQQRKLLDHGDLLLKWNRVYNLTAIRDAGEMLTHHLLDSLSAVARIAELARRAQPDAPRVLDVGSGGGLPGIPLAIAYPDVSVTMVDIVQKKTALLTQCRAELDLRLKPFLLRSSRQDLNHSQRRGGRGDDRCNWLFNSAIPAPRRETALSCWYRDQTCEPGVLDRLLGNWSD